MGGRPPSLGLPEHFGQPIAEAPHASLDPLPAPAERLGADQVDRAAAVDHEVGSVEDAPLLQESGIVGLPERVVGGAGDDGAGEPRNRVVVRFSRLHGLDMC